MENIVLERLTTQCNTHWEIYNYKKKKSKEIYEYLDRNDNTTKFLINLAF